eukprot:scaffold111_cov252-Pinguiococcus_pyrenoidosus.AAC.14
MNSLRDGQLNSFSVVCLPGGSAARAPQHGPFCDAAARAARGAVPAVRCERLHAPGGVSETGLSAPGKCVVYFEDAAGLAKEHGGPSVRQQ